MGETKRFGFLGGCRVTVKDGYLEVVGAVFNERASAPVSAIEVAVAQKANVRHGLTSMNQPCVVLVGRGAELGRAALATGRMRAAQQAARWINAYLASIRAAAPGTG